MIAPVLVRGIWYNAPNTSPVPFSESAAASFAALLLEEGETLEIRPVRPGTSSRWTGGRSVAYGVRAGRYRALPIAVNRTVEA